MKIKFLYYGKLMIFRGSFTIKIRKFSYQPMILLKFEGRILVNAHPGKFYVASIESFNSI